MKTPVTASSLAVLGLAMTAVFTPTARAHDAASPNPDQILRQMSDKLSGAQQLSFKAHRTMDAALTMNGAAISNARIEATVQRPNRIAARAVGGGDARRFVFDGRSLTVHDEKNKFYATVPMRKTIDGLVDSLDEDYGFTLPLAEFILSNPYKDLRHQSEVITYRGRGAVRAGLFSPSVDCHRLSLSSGLADAELWVGVADHLPHKFVVTFKKHPDWPQLKAEFSSWNLAAKPSDKDFAFVAPKGAMQIEMLKTKKN